MCKGNMSWSNKFFKYIYPLNKSCILRLSKVDHLILRNHFFSLLISQLDCSPLLLIGVWLIVNQEGCLQCGQPADSASRPGQNLCWGHAKTKPQWKTCALSSKKLHIWHDWQMCMGLKWRVFSSVQKKNHLQPKSGKMKEHLIEMERFILDFEEIFFF